MNIYARPWFKLNSVSSPVFFLSTARKRQTHRSSAAGLATLLLFTVCMLFSSKTWALGGNASGDDTPDTAASKNSDARAIRLSSVEGQVQVTQDSQVIADPAYANLPLFEGSQIITGNDGRAEVQFEDGSVARLSPNTTLTLTVLQPQGTGTRTEIVLNGGLAYFELQPNTAEHSLRVYYGQASFTASAFSVVRLTEDAPPGDLAVLSGNVHLEHGDNLQLDIHGGENLTLDASDLSQYNLSQSIQPDSWDSWNADRDQVLNAQSAERTSASNSLGNYQDVGLNDLDANGSWYNVPGQGYIWSPYDAQSAGGAWDPYGYGHWVYYPRYGYVWVSGYGWGYAPFQCGLWNYYDSFGWGWAPGSGCNPWWGGGGGYYGAGGWHNIGNGPRGYRPPRRPFPGPVHPRPGPRQGGGVPRTMVDSVAVDHRSSGERDGFGGPRTAEPVTIAGHTVEPLRPIAPRPGYSKAGSSFVNRSAPVTYGSGTAGAHPIYNGSPYGSGLRPSPGQPGNRPSAPVSRPAPAPNFPSGGGSHPASGGGAAPHGGGGSPPHK